MKSQNVVVKTGSWCGDRMLTLTFPSHWTVEIHDGIARPVLQPSQIEASFKNPVEGFTLESLLLPLHKVAVVVDDHTRPTPTADVLRHLFDIFRRCGIPDRNITIIVALGTHILKERTFIKEKLKEFADGESKIVFPDCRKRDNLVYIGKSDSGIPVYINKHFFDADVKIAISGIYPHDEAGFSGGAKILIGILGLETLSRFHRKHGLLQRGSNVETDFRREVEHFADLVKLDYIINCIIDKDKKITGLYCGDFRKAFRLAAQEAKSCLATSVNPNADVIISNAYPLDTALSVLGKSIWPFKYSKIKSHKIILVSLCSCTTDRIPLASSRKERFVQGFKRAIGATALKRLTKTITTRLNILRNPNSKWERASVIYITHIDPKLKSKPNIINNCYVEYSWDNIIQELLSRMGDSNPITVSIHPCTPLMFPKL